jgi:hypothetical protein
MNRLVAAALALTVGATLAGCGSTTSKPLVEPDLAGKPVWTCQERAGQFIDYTADAGGKPTARAALAPYRTAGDHVVVVPPRAHHNRQWLLVDDDQSIHASLELDQGRDGWLVASLEKCAH